MTPFEHLAQNLDELAGAPARAALAAAPAVAEALKARFAGGQFRGLTAKTTGRADGPAIVLELDPRLTPNMIHLDGFPPELEAPIVKALAEEGPR
jgi:hypothetical protein